MDEQRATLGQPAPSEDEMPARDPRTMEQQRASAAWRAVSSVPDEDGVEYRSVVRSVPAMIQANGLGPTLAFLKAKKKQHETVYSHVSQWVCKALNPSNPGDDLIQWAVLDEQSGANRYRRATQECLVYLTWLKRFAEARFPSSNTAPPAGDGDADPTAPAMQ